MSLAQLNAELVAIWADENTDTEQLHALITRREQLVVEHLERLAASERSAFARAEIAVNELLQQLITPIYSSAYDQFNRLVQGKKALKKYQP